MLSLPQLSRRAQSLKVLIVVFILAIAVVQTIPSYITGQWSWSKLPEVPHVQQLRELKQGLALPDWQTAEHQVMEIGGHDWSVQTLVSVDTSAETALPSSIVLMLRPQTRQRDQPQVDWIDINGWQQWTADSYERLQFQLDESAFLDGTTPDNPATLRAQPIDINTRFFRGWNQKQTYAVVQWYAWTNGGSPSPSRWFWVDQLSQWQNRHRMPWVAVSVLIPMKPLGDIESVRPFAQTLGQTIQSALVTHAFNPRS